MLENPPGTEIQQSAESFGMTEADVKNYKVKSFFSTIGFYFAKIEPTLIKVLQTIVYYSIKFIKAVTIDVFKMVVKGGA